MLLHSLNVDIRTRSLPLQETLDELYTSNDLTASLPASPRPLTLRIERRDSPHALPLRPITAADGVFAETNLCGAPCFYAGGRFFAAAGGDDWRELDYDVEHGVVRANVGGRYVADPRAVVIDVVRAILQSFVLPFHGLKALHGAVVSRGERTLMLRGAGGSGKSTTALRLLADGWYVLSDDAPLFAYDNGRTCALSSLDYFHVTRDTVRLLPWLEDHVIGNTGVRDKLAVASAGLQPGEGWRQPLTVTHLIELSRAPVPAPRLTPVDRGAATAALLGAEMLVFRPGAIRADSARLRAYSSFIFDLLTAMTRVARVLRLEFDDRHLPDLPGLLTGSALDA